jgi:hydroxymethylbilane synthase
MISIQARGQLSRSRRVVVGTRASQLALAQTDLVVRDLKSHHPDLEAAIEEITTQGDRDAKASLTQIGGRGIFVKELEEALLTKRIDVAVHSLKDVPTEVSPGLELVAFPQREDARDVLVSKSGRGLMDLPEEALLGTGSRRREVQLRACRPDVRVSEIRGNVDTRLRKVFEGKFDGILLAAAALIRLGWEDRITEPLPVGSFLPAAGQGVLGIQIRSGDEEVAEIVSALNHELTSQSALAERAFLRHLGGGCRAPIAALGVVEGSTLVLDGMVASEDGSQILRDREGGSAGAAEDVGRRLAERILEKGASSFLAPDCA